MNKVRQKFGFVDFFVRGAHTRNHKYVFTNSCLFQRIPILECERPSWKLPALSPSPLSFRWSISSSSTVAGGRSNPLRITNNCSSAVSIEGKEGKATEAGEGRSSVRPSVAGGRGRPPGGRASALIPRLEKEKTDGRTDGRTRTEILLASLSSRRSGIIGERGQQAERRREGRAFSRNRALSLSRGSSEPLLLVYYAWPPSRRLPCRRRRRRRHLKVFL